MFLLCVFSDEGADPDSQDTYGNTVLHMVVIVEQLGQQETQDKKKERNRKKKCTKYNISFTYLKKNIIDS